METLKLTHKEAQRLKDKQVVDVDELIYGRSGVYLTVEDTKLPNISKVLSDSKIDTFNGDVASRIIMLVFILFVLSIFLLAEIMSTN